MPALGQSRHFGRRPTTSGLPLDTDTIRVGRHVSKVPLAGFEASAFSKSRQFRHRKSGFGSITVMRFYSPPRRGTAGTTQGWSAQRRGGLEVNRHLEADGHGNGLNVTGRGFYRPVDDGQKRIRRMHEAGSSRRR
jgi:hypothetical protein